MASRTAEALWRGEETTALFRATLYRSPFSDEPPEEDIEDIEIVSVEWLGHEMPIAELPEEVQKRLFEIADDLEWEGVE